MNEKGEISNKQVGADSGGEKQDAQEKQALEMKKLQDRLSRIQNKILVLSGKGGVGKSTVAANLAAALAEAGKNVGLLDIDVHGPSLPKIMGLEGKKPEVIDSAIQPIRLKENLKVMSIGFLLQNRDDAVIWRGPMKHGVINQFLKDVEWGDLDYLIVDSPPGTGDEPLSIAHLIGAGAGAVIVTTPQDLSISDVRRCINFCRKVNVKILGVLENMSGFICPHCGNSVEIFKTGGGESMAKEMNERFLGRIPLEPTIVQYSDQGKSFMDKAEDSPAAQAFRNVVKKITGEKSEREDAPGESVPVEKKEETGKMRIAVPLAEGCLSLHFGHCENFALMDLDMQNKEILETQIVPAPPHQPGLLPTWLKEKGAQVIIASGMGRRAQQLFEQNNIDVVIGAPSLEPDKIAHDYMHGQLQTGENICDH